MVDYSKWKDIEVSDDEDDTHPNIDTPSLFRWRHEARVQRMQEHDAEKQKLASDRDKHKNKTDELTKKLQLAKQKGLSNVDDLQRELDKVVSDEAEARKQWTEFEKKEKLMPWNVDTISSPGFSKTVINSQSQPGDEVLSDDQREQRLRTFINKHEKQIKQYGMLQKFDDSKRFLTDNMHLVCEDTANYLVIWAINLEMEEKHNLMEHVAHQCICMNYLLELAKQLDVNPKSCVASFFSKIQMADSEYKRSFYDEIDAFKSRIRKRAKEKIDEAIREHEEEEKQNRLGPGNLDPVEVFETLPEALQKCFESRDIDLLKRTVAEMDETEARYHMKRCVDSGLWVADASTITSDDSAQAQSTSDKTT